MDIDFWERGQLTLVGFCGVFSELFLVYNRFLIISWSWWSFSLPTTLCWHFELSELVLILFLEVRSAVLLKNTSELYHILCKSYSIIEFFFLFVVTNLGCSRYFVWQHFQYFTFRQLIDFINIFVYLIGHFNYFNKLIAVIKQKGKKSWCYYYRIVFFLSGQTGDCSK